MYLIFRHMKPLFRIVLPRYIRHQIESRQTGLTTRGHEHQNRFYGRVRSYGGVGWLVHGGHSGTVVFPGKPIDVDLQLDRPHSWVEIE